jgi:SH3-like domain-containing protein
MMPRFLTGAIALCAAATVATLATVATAGSSSPMINEAADARIGPSGLPVPRFVALKKSEVRARFGPSFDYPVAYEFRKQGLPLKVIAEDRDNVWRRVEDRDGQRMWIHRSMLAPNANAVVQVDTAILRAAPREDSNGRAKLTAGVLAEVETCEENWCRLKAGKFRGWLPADSLWGVSL